MGKKSKKSECKGGKVSKSAKKSFVEYLTKSLQDTALKTKFLGVSTFNEVKTLLQKYASAEAETKHPTNLLDNKGHLLDIVSSATQGEGGGELRLHWEDIQAAHRKAFEDRGGKQGVDQRKAMLKAIREAKRAHKEELKNQRLAKEGPEREAKQERIALKATLHEARLVGMCLDFVKGKCDFGSKCTFSHEDETGEMQKLIAKTREKLGDDKVDGFGKRKEGSSKKAKKQKVEDTLNADFDSSSDEDEEHAKPRKSNDPKLSWSKSQDDISKGSKKSSNLKTNNEKKSRSLSVKSGHVDKKSKKAFVVVDGKKKKLRSATGRHEKRAAAHRSKQE